MDIKYNYLIGKSEDLPSEYDYDRRPDPDIDGCFQLYEDLRTIYFSTLGDSENKEQQFSYNKYRDRTILAKLWEKYFLLNNKNSKKESARLKPPFYTIFYKDFKLSSDYIGPSIYWAKQDGLSSNEIIEILNISRRIGGHIVWPRGRRDTINTVRGGKDTFYDRIDWALFLLKLCYENNFDLPNIKKRIESYQFDNDIINRCIILVKTMIEDRQWFIEFGTFDGFCEHFLLKNSFVESDLSIRWFAPKVPLKSENYKLFAMNNVEAIKIRNQIIKEKK